MSENENENKEMPESNNPSGEALLQSSVAYGLRTVRKLQLEITLLSIENEKLTELADALGKFRRENLPPEELPLADEDIFYKWSEQAGRYYAAAKEVFEILQSKYDHFQKVFPILKDEMKQLGMTMPEDVEKKAIEIKGIQ